MIGILRGADGGTSLAGAASGLFDRPGWAGIVSRTATLVIPFGVFALVLTTELPASVLISSRQLLTPVVAAALVLLIGCHRWRGWIGSLAGLSVTLALFALPLAALWQDASFHANAIGGLLPWSDASDYYHDARRLLDGHLLGWSARRPLFVGLLSTLLALTGQNLQVSIAAMVAINAVASFLFARELRESCGAVAAAVGTVLLFLFYRNIGGLGTTLSENLGLALGACGFAALLRGARNLESRSLFVGLGLITVALMSRAGAFFVLPALVLAVGWMFREDRRWIRMAGGAVVTIMVAAILSLGVGRRLVDPSSGQAAFSNFSYSLYGLVVGGKGWRQVLQDHPSAKEGAEIYALAYQAFIDRPMGLVEGSLKMWWEYLRPSGFNAFVFVGRPASYPGQIATCYLLCGIAIVASCIRIRQPLHALVVAATVGHLASIPFVPPVDAGIRVYAVTVPILAILVALGLDVALKVTRGGARVVWLPSADLATPRDRSQLRSRSAERFGLGLAAISLAGPLFALSLSRQPHLAALNCGDGTSAVHLRISNGSFLRIRSDSDPAGTGSTATEILESRLALTAGMVEINGDVPRLTAGHTIFNGYDLQSGRYVWLVTPSALVEKAPAIYAICGHDSADAVSRNYGVFYADSVWHTSDSRP